MAAWSESPPGTPNPLLLVGLGGAGFRVALQLRSRLRESRHEEGAWNVLVVALPSQASLQDGTALDQGEYACIGGAGDPSREDWATELGLSPHSSEPPGTSRPLGRLALRRNYLDEVEPRLRAALERAMEACPAGGTVRVFLVASAGSATGGALVPDVAQAVRYAAGDWPLAVEAILFLPSVFAEDLRDDFLKIDALKANTYATLMELEPLVADPSSPRRDAPPLLDRCSLVGMTNEMLRSLRHSDQVMAMVAESLVLESCIPSHEWQAQRQREHERWRGLPPLAGHPRVFSSLSVSSLACSGQGLESYVSLRMIDDILRQKLLADPGEQDGAAALHFLNRSDLEQQRLHNACSRLLAECLARAPEGEFSEADFENAAAGRFPRVMEGMHTTEKELLESHADPWLRERFDRWRGETRTLVQCEIMDTFRENGVVAATQWCESMRVRLAETLQPMEEQLEQLRELGRRYWRRMQRCLEVAEDTLRNVFMLGRRERLMAIAREYLREIRGHYANAIEERVRSEAATMLLELQSQLDGLQQRLAPVHAHLVATHRDVEEQLRQLSTDLCASPGIGFEIDLLGLEQMEAWYRASCRPWVQTLSARLLESGEGEFPFEQWAQADLLCDVMLPLARAYVPSASLPTQVLDLMETSPLPPDALPFLHDHGVPANPQGGVNAWMLLAVTSCRPFWVYHRDALGDAAYAFEVYHLAADDLADPRLAEFIQRAPNLLALPSGNPRRITFRTESHGLPAFALGQVHDWKLAYEQALMEKRRPLHLCRAWSNLPDLLP